MNTVLLNMKEEKIDGRNKKLSNIYVASSWRNELQPLIVESLRNEKHSVYDFKNPFHGLGGFHWSELDKNWKNWNSEDYRKKLYESPIAAQGFMSDMRAMEWADICVLVLPCGKSAHLELGWFSGRGKNSYIYIPPNIKIEPELMYLMNTYICISIEELLTKLNIEKGED